MSTSIFVCAACGEPRCEYCDNVWQCDNCLRYYGEECDLGEFELESGGLWCKECLDEPEL